MLIIAAGLVILGAVVAIMGIKIFRVLLPILGFIAGVMVGFSGTQVVFGSGGVSVAIGVITGVLVGVLMAILSFFYFELALAILLAIIFANAFVYLGLALGINEHGFLGFLLGATGAVIGLAIALTVPLAAPLVVAFSAFFGVAMVMAGIMLTAGSVSLDQLSNHGIISTVADQVNNRFVWLIVWIGATIITANIQTGLIKREFLQDKYAFTD